MSTQSGRTDATSKTSAPTTSNPPVPITREQTWLDPGTWSLSTKFFPVYIALVGVFIAIYYFRVVLEPGLDLSSYEDCTASFNYTFRVNAVMQQTRDYANQSWELAAAFDAFTQIHNPERSVFAANPFPKGKPPPLSLRLDWSSDYARSVFTAKGESLKDDDHLSTIAGPASLGLAAVMLGQRWSAFDQAATRQLEILLKSAPRFGNGAIGFRQGTPELRAEAINMFPPFLAYYGVAHDDLDLVREAVTQARLYRDALAIPRGSKKGLWKHSVGASAAKDEGAWSTANAAAIYGMAKVRAIISKWATSNTALMEEKTSLDSWIEEILDAAIKVDDDKSRLLRNYLGDKSWGGEVAGTSLMAATVYRMAVINPERFASDKYMEWADRKRRAVFAHIDDDGFPTLIANPYEPLSRAAVKVSPEAEAYILLLGTAWRDSVCAGLRLDNYQEETGDKIARWRTLEEIVASHSLESATGFSFERLYRYLKAP